MLTLFDADVVHIGYPKAASTFLRKYMVAHPDIDLMHQQSEEMLFRKDFKVIEKPNKNKVMIHSDEYIAGSACAVGDPSVWSKHLYNPGAFNLVRYDMVIDPEEAAKRIYRWLPNAKILIVTREPVSWFESLYKYSVARLPPNQRTFYDYWITPQGMAMRNAGIHRLTIDAYRKRFKHVLAVRYEDLGGLSGQLCAWLGVRHIEFPIKRENEGHSGLAKLHKAFPSLSGLPLCVKSALKPLARFIPKTHPVLSNRDLELIRAFYGIHAHVQ